MKKQLSAHLLNKYLQGECTPEEEVLINEWYKSFEGDDDHISSISETEREILKSRIRQGIKRPIPAEVPVIDHPRSRTRLLIYSIPAIAACVIIALTVLLNHNDAKQPASAEMVSITNNTPNIYNQGLSDGSHVWLSPGAQIKFSKVFSGHTREVYMSGESFFEVTKNAAKPFIIYSANLVTKVWGTSFRVRDSKRLRFADVTVVTGKVSVKLLHEGSLQTGRDTHSMKSQEVMIYPDQQAIYNKNVAVLNDIHKADMKELRIWKKLNIVFDNKQMKDVLPVLNKEFGVNIYTRDEKIGSYLLNADFNGLNLPDVLELLHKTLNIRYVMDGADISLNSN
ncbi:MAG: FecR domain-containing protein [Bacteroidota bacterium]|nr:FecR domain-containing protein [Bacteroidota bacterium]